MKIDVFSHILPKVFLDATLPYGGMGISNYLTDMGLRTEQVRSYEGLSQILTLNAPEIFENIPADKAMDLCRLANDSVGEIVKEYPDCFPTAMATVYMGDVDASIREIERCIRDYGFRGIQLTTTYQEKPLSSEEFFPLYEKMVELGLPIEVHPCNGPMSKPDFIFNWPLETTWMMVGLATSGVFEKLPEIKFVTHHCGAMIPVWHNRVFKAWFQNRMYTAPGDKSPEEYFNNLKKFYNDTALYGDCTSGLQAGIDFFGADHILFGTDAPLNGVRDLNGQGETEATIKSIEALKISESEKQLIFAENAKKLFKL